MPTKTKPFDPRQEIVPLKVDIAPGKKGGEVLLQNGARMKIEENQFDKKDKLTSVMVPPSRRADFSPPLAPTDRLVSNIYVILAVKPLKTPVRLFLPSLTSELKDVKVMYRDKIKNEWMMVTEREEDKEAPGMWLQMVQLGLFALVWSTARDSFFLTPNGGLFNGTIHPLISLRVPKRSCPVTQYCNLQVLELNKDRISTGRLHYVREVSDVEDLSAFFDFDLPGVEFKRSVTLRLPLPDWATGELIENGSEKALQVLVKYNNTWNLVESHLKFTKTTVTFETRILGKFCLIKPRDGYRQRTRFALPRLEDINAAIRGDILAFTLFDDNIWYLWVECVCSNDAVRAVQEKVANGFGLLKKVDDRREKLEQELKASGLSKHAIRKKKKQLEEEACRGPQEVEFSNGIRYTIRVEGDLQIKVDDTPLGGAAFGLKSGSPKSSPPASPAPEESKTPQLMVPTNSRVNSPSEKEKAKKKKDLVLQYHEILGDTYRCFEVEPVDGTGDIVRERLRAVDARDRQNQSNLNEGTNLTDIQPIVPPSSPDQVVKNGAENGVPEISPENGASENSVTNGAKENGAENVDVPSEQPKTKDLQNGRLPIIPSLSSRDTGMTDISEPELIEDFAATITILLTTSAQRTPSPLSPPQSPKDKGENDHQVIAFFRVSIPLEAMRKYLSIPTLAEEEALQAKTAQDKVKAEEAAKAAEAQKVAAQSRQSRASASGAKRSFERLTAPTRPPRAVAKESKVLTGRSLKCLARCAQEGLTLAVHLKLPESVITGIGFDCLSQKQSLSDLTYKILTHWKRTFPPRERDQMVNVLATALCEMGQESAAAVVVQSHQNNLELRDDSFKRDSFLKVNSKESDP